MDVEAGVEQWVLIIDFNGYALKNAPPMHVSRSVLDTMQIQYAERLGQVFIVDPPAYFWFFYKAISPFIGTPPRLPLPLSLIQSSIPRPSPPCVSSFLLLLPTYNRLWPLSELKVRVYPNCKTKRRRTR